MSGTLATFTVSLYFLNACEEGQRGKAGRYRGCDGEDVNEDTGDDEEEGMKSKDEDNNEDGF